MPSHAEVLAMAFKVYHGRDENALKQKYLNLVKAFQLARTTSQTP